MTQSRTPSGTRFMEMGGMMNLKVRNAIVVPGVWMRCLQCRNRHLPFVLTIGIRFNFHVSSYPPPPPHHHHHHDHDHHHHHHYHTTDQFSTSHIP